MAEKSDLKEILDAQTDVLRTMEVIQTAPPFSYGEFSEVFYGETSVVDSLARLIEACSPQEEKKGSHLDGHSAAKIKRTVKLPKLGKDEKLVLLASSERWGSEASVPHKRLNVLIRDPVYPFITRKIRRWAISLREGMGSETSTLDFAQVDYGKSGVRYSPSTFYEMFDMPADQPRDSLVNRHRVIGGEEFLAISEEPHVISNFRDTVWDLSLCLLLASGARLSIASDEQVNSEDFHLRSVDGLEE